MHDWIWLWLAFAVLIYVLLYLFLKERRKISVYAEDKDVMDQAIVDLARQGYFVTAKQI